MQSKLHDDSTGWVYTFSPYNRLINATEHTVTGYSGNGGNQTPIYGDVIRGDYRYNGLGQRVEKSTGGVSTRYVYGLNGQLLSEGDSAGTPQRDYVTLNGEPLAVITYTEQQGGLGTVIDNGEAGTSATGTWTTTTDNRNTQWGSDYLMASGQTGSTYRWTPTLTSGIYNVYTWYVADNKAATQVPYTLVHNGVTDVVNIDQTTNGGQWVLLGTYTFSGDGTEYVEVSDANGQTNADALRFDPQGLPPQLVADIYYIHTDQLATPRAITDSSGTVVWRWESDPFGTSPANEDADGDGNGFVYNPRFPGQYYDSETGLHYNYFRDYDPAMGRYIESDPIGLDGGPNTYLYVLNSPVMLIDPSGLTWQNGVPPTPFSKQIPLGAGPTLTIPSRLRGAPAPIKGPSGKISTEKYLNKRWDKATFGTKKKSIEYHVNKHGKGMSPKEYTQRAEKCFNNPNAKKSPYKDLLGRDAVRVVSPEGSGLFTPQGKIIWFHPN